jgi:hypothetical protein
MKNIFDLHKDVLTEYKAYIDSFINIADNRILSTVKKDFDSGNLYPEPLVQFNPSFESGGSVEGLVNNGVLVKDFNHIFYDGEDKSWSIYKHQTEAIVKGNEGKSFDVTSGTGSGKSLTYISTIFNHLFRLLELNHKIHEEEKASGLLDKKKTVSKKSNVVNEPQAGYGGNLFNQEN